MRLLLILTILLVGGKIFAQTFPDVKEQLVNDLGGVLSESEEQRLERKLIDFDDSTSNQIAIVTINSLAKYTGDPIDNYAWKLYERMGIGRAKENNGVLILVARDERKVRIEVGKGLEPVITDGLSKRIIEQIIIPNFKEGNFYKGLDEGTDVLMSLAIGEYNESMLANKKKDKKFPWGFLVPIGIFFFLSFLFGRRRNSNTQMTGRGYRSTGPIWWGGGFGGGRSGGGGFGGGGFGGFGGGISGGGGASGGW